MARVLKISLVSLISWGFMFLAYAQLDDQTSNEPATYATIVNVGYGTSNH